MTTQDPQQKTIRTRGWITPRVEKLAKKCCWFGEWYAGPRKYRDEKATSERAIKVDTYIALWLVAELVAFVVVSLCAGLSPYHCFKLMVILVSCIVIAIRLIEIPAYAIHSTVEDKEYLKGDEGKVASAQRMVLLGFVNFIELIAAYAVIYAAARSYGMLTRGPGVTLPLDWFDPLYFSASTELTIGYGDITPTGLLRAIAMFQTFSSLILLVVIVSRYVSYLSPVREVDMNSKNRGTSNPDQK